MENSNQSGGNLKSKFKFSSQSKASKEEKKDDLKEKENFNIDELKKYYVEFMINYNKIEEELVIFDKNFESQIISKEELKKSLEEIAEKIKTLKEDYKNNASFLVGYDKQNYMNMLDDLMKSLEEKKEKLNPKKKFAFSNKSTTTKETSIKSENINENLTNTVKTNFKADSNEFLIIDKSNLEKYIVSKEELGNKNNLIIENIKDSEIYLLHSFKAVYLKNISNCKILIGSVAGGTHITNCTDSILHLATHQLRIHQTHRTVFNIIATSNPIIEDCFQLIFSPLNICYARFSKILENAKIDMCKNKWNQVLDFKWHKKEKSPNFELKENLSEMIRRADSLEMEIHISSMLEKVLDSDSDSEEKDQIKVSENLYRGTRKFKQDAFTFACEAPRLLHIGQPNFEKKIEDFSSSEEFFWQKGETRANTVDYSLKDIINMRNYQTPVNGSSSSVNTKNSQDRRDSQLSKNSSGSFLNEVFEELLENKVKLADTVDEEAHAFLQGNYLTIISSQIGSRILQRALAHTSPCIITVIFSEIEQGIPDLMTDSYANYFCQKFFSVLDENDRLRFLCIVGDHIVEIGNSKIGTYPLQTILDQLKTEKEKKIIIDSVREKVICMSFNPQGTHVIENMLKLFEERRIPHIYENIVRNFFLLTNNANGLCVIKKIIAHAKNVETMKLIRKIIADNAMCLVQNAFGNYAIQSALEYWAYEFCFPIIEKFFGNFYLLSLQKYSSNVIEKSFDNEIVVNRYIEEMFNSNVSEVMKHSYGNYVVQRALKFAKGSTKITFAKYIQQNIPLLNDRKLMKKWQTIITNSLLLGVTRSDLNNLNLCGMSNSMSMPQMSNHSPQFGHVNFTSGQNPMPRISKSYNNSPALIPETLQYCMPPNNFNEADINYNPHSVSRRKSKFSNTLFR